MVRTHVITGAASGIGAATAHRLRGRGHKVIGVDLKDADVVADLSTPDGRTDMVERVRALAPEGIDGVLASAGVANPERLGLVVATNYFGTVSVLEGLHPQLRKPGARCVAVSSVGMFDATDAGIGLEEACLAGDERAALTLAETKTLTEVYPATKRALTRWSRETAVKPEWAGAGVLLNVVGPGVILTPMTTRAQSNPEVWAKVTKAAPSAVGRYAPAEDIAELMDFLLNLETGHLVGQVIFFDSGATAMSRPNI